MTVDSGKMRYSLFCFTVVLSFVHFSVRAQKQDSVIYIDSAFTVLDSLSDEIIPEEDQVELSIFKRPKKLDPDRAAILSAAFPGLGQIYNGHAWKLPIIYGGAILFGVWIDYNHRMYQVFRNESIALRNFEGGRLGIQSDRLDNFNQRFRRDRDYAIILGCAFYLLQIADAHVSAHLKEFDVSEDITMNILPGIESTNTYAQSFGITLKFNFR